jgi:2,3-bisphosphoglycerate-dependent phosphoglycerate mutase
MKPHPTYDLVIIRHGQSEWNKLNIFTGWRDSPLSEAGIAEARAAGNRLRQDGFTFDFAFTSLQSRAIKTLWLVLEELDEMWLPVEKAWQLNERHYGSLQGKNKKEAGEQFGAEQVHKWRRGYATRPPLVAEASEDYPGHDPRYRTVPRALLPRGESLKDVAERVLPYWRDHIVPHIKRGEKVLIAAHGNSLRALLMHLEGLSADEIEAVNLPTGIPKVYQLNNQFLSAGHHFHGAPDEVMKKIDSVANQASH